MNFTRSPKSSCDWGQNELIAYNISLSSISPQEFYRSVPEPPLNHLDANILNAHAGAKEPDVSDAVASYLSHLDLAYGCYSRECHIVDFAVRSLELLGFNERGTVVSTRYDMPLQIVAETRSAQTDVCILDVSRMMVLLVLVAVEGPPLHKPNAEAQVIAQAIAAFQSNNNERSERGLTPLPAMTIPCIKMVHTRPTFYLVPVTQELEIAVENALYPSSVTRVSRCVTLLDDPKIDVETGMENTEYRRLALKRLLAFKTLAKGYWSHILER